MHFISGNIYHISYRDYAGIRKGTLCDRQAAVEFIGIAKEDFIKESYSVIDDDAVIEKLW